MIQYRYKKGICVMEVNKMKKILLIMTMIMAFSFGNCFASQVQVSDEGAYNVYQKVINTMVKYIITKRNVIRYSNSLDAPIQILNQSE